MEELMDPYETNRIKIFWDMENAPLPKDSEHRTSIITNMQRALTNSRLKGKVSLQVIGQKRYFAKGLINELEQAGNENFKVKVKVVKTRFVPGKETEDGTVPALVQQKEVSDTVLVDLLVEYMLCNTPPPPANVIIISGDSDFSKCIAELRKKGYNTIAVLTSNAKCYMVASADIVWFFSDFIAGLGPFYKKRTFVEKLQNMQPIGYLTHVFSIMQGLQEERVSPSELNIRYAYEGLEVDADELGRLKDTLRLGGYYEKLVVENIPGLNCGVYRFANQALWMCYDTLNVRAEDFGQETWKQFAHSLKSNKVQLINKLKLPCNIYAAALRMRSSCAFLENYFLGSVMAMVRIMGQQLKWIQYNYNDAENYFTVKYIHWQTISDYTNGQDQASGTVECPLVTFKNLSHSIPCPRSPMIDDKQITYLCWDFESTPVPTNFDVENAIPSNMVSAIRNLKINGPIVTIDIFAKPGVVPKDFVISLITSNIEVQQIRYKPGARSALSPKIPFTSALFSFGFLPKANFVFITANDYYAKVMKTLKRRNHNIFLVQGEDCTAKLTSRASVRWTLIDFIRGLPPYFNMHALSLRKERMESLNSSIVDNVAELLKVLNVLREEKKSPTLENIQAHYPEGKLIDSTLEWAIELGAVVKEKHGQKDVYRFTYEPLWRN